MKFFWRKIPDPLIPVQSYRAMLATTVRLDLPLLLQLIP